MTAQQQGVTQTGDFAHRIMQTLSDTAVQNSTLMPVSLNPNSKCVSKLLLNKFHKSHKSSDQPVISVDLQPLRTSWRPHTILELNLWSDPARFKTEPNPFPILHRNQGLIKHMSVKCNHTLVIPASGRFHPRDWLETINAVYDNRTNCLCCLVHTFPAWLQPELKARTFLVPS